MGITAIFFTVIAANMLGAGAFSGLVTIAAFTVGYYPIELIRCRMIMSLLQKEEHKYYMRYLDAYHKILSEEGFLGLYKGGMTYHLSFLMIGALHFTPYPSILRAKYL